MLVRNEWQWRLGDLSCCFLLFLEYQIHSNNGAHLKTASQASGGAQQHANLQHGADLWDDTPSEYRNKAPTSLSSCFPPTHLASSI